MEGRWEVMLDFRAYLASVWVIQVVLGGLEGRWVVMLDQKAYFVSL